MVGKREGIGKTTDHHPPSSSSSYPITTTTRPPTLSLSLSISLKHTHTHTPVLLQLQLVQQVPFAPSMHLHEGDVAAWHVHARSTWSTCHKHAVQHGRGDGGAMLLLLWGWRLGVLLIGVVVPSVLRCHYQWCCCCQGVLLHE